MSNNTLKCITTQFIFFVSIITLSFLIDSACAQAVDHWETVVYSGNVWKYYTGTHEPESDWRTVDFKNSQWPEGKGGIGYGDRDDYTVIEPTISLYMRQKFTIINKNKISLAALNIDYDDAFVAYLNNVEIARSNIGEPGDFPAFNQVADEPKEAQMYQGGRPEYYYLDNTRIRSILKEGENVLAVQVHNHSLDSSDLSAIAFLSVGLIDANSYYGEVPNWFRPQRFVDLTSSNLPVVIINTHGETIPNEPRIAADMGIINNPGGQRNNVSDPVNGYNGKIQIEIRGKSSQMYPKKSYRIETVDSTGENLNVSLLGLPEENDWILYAPYSDKSLIRNVLSFHLARGMRQYASRTQYFELVLNGQYQGLYVLMETIKRDKNRVNIARLNPDENSGDDITGGYIIKVDKKEGFYDGWQSPVKPILSGWRSNYYQYHEPEYDEISTEQKKYIQDFMLQFENALNSSKYKDPDSGYTRFINMDSFVDHMILQELTKEIDSYKFSTFMYKDKDSKDGRLYMGPFWDFNLGYGNVNFGGEKAWEPEGWMYNKKYPHMYWWYRMMRDDTFKKRFQSRWWELRERIFHTDSILTFIDTQVNLLQEAGERNFQLWPVIGEYVWPNYFVGETWQEEIDFLRDWVIDRLDWIDDNIEKSGAGIAAGQNNPKPVNYALNYPNPFKNRTTIAYQLFKLGMVKIDIYNILGEKVRTLENPGRSAGHYRIVWDGHNLAGRPVSAGLYLYTLQVDGRVMLKGKLVRH